jgi:hypothetical protein
VRDQHRAQLWNGKGARIEIGLQIGLIVHGDMMLRSQLLCEASSSDKSSDCCLYRRDRRKGENRDLKRGA